MVGGGSVRFLAGEDGVLVGEASEVVDVSIGVVAFDAFFQPKDLGDPEAVTEFLFGLFAREVRVAVFIEQDSFCGEELAAAVHFDCAALEDHSALVAGKVYGMGDFFRDGVIEVPWLEFSSPGIEFPIGDGDFGSDRVFDKNGAVIAAPDIVVGVVEEIEV